MLFNNLERDWVQMTILKAQLALVSFWKSKVGEGNKYGAMSIIAQTPSIACCSLELPRKINKPTLSSFWDH